MDLPDPGIKQGSPALQADSLSTELSGKLKDIERLKAKDSIYIVIDLIIIQNSTYFMPFLCYHNKNFLKYIFK